MGPGHTGDSTGARFPAPLARLATSALAQQSGFGLTSGVPERGEWPREESNLRTQIRSLPLYPLSYGAASVRVAA